MAKVAYMNKVVNILLVEDDHLDIIDIQRTLDKFNIIHKLQIAKNGEEAIQILENQSASERPDIILIDINMPKMNGLEFLHIIRNKDDWKDFKCFMLTTSEDHLDKKVASDLGISGYIIKPLKLNNPSSIDSFNLMIDLMNVK